MSKAIRIGVISDTHGVVRPAVQKAFQGVDRILHAGDIDKQSVLMELGRIAPVVAVRGNMDSAHYFPDLLNQRSVEIGGITAVLIHNIERLRNPPPGTMLIICGHTHQKRWEDMSDSMPPVPLKVALKKGCGFILNPGCAGKRTAEPSVAVLTLNGTKMEIEFISL